MRTLNSQQLVELVEPFKFDNNDQETRDKIVDTLNEYFNNNVQVQEFIVKCDEDNNTEERINKFELWIDIAAMELGEKEFTYYPIRITRAEPTNG